MVGKEPTKSGKDKGEQRHRVWGLVGAGVGALAAGVGIGFWDSIEGFVRKQWSQLWREKPAEVAPRDYLGDAKAEGRVLDLLKDNKGELSARFSVPPEVGPGEDIQCTATFDWGSETHANSEIWITVHRSWSPEIRMVIVPGVKVGHLDEKQFDFVVTAPTEPGVHHIRLVAALALGPVHSYYGDHPTSKGLEAPGVAPMGERSFRVKRR